MLPDDKRVKFTYISDNEMADRMDDYFWYVVDLELGDPDAIPQGEIVANPFVDDMAERSFVFENENDAWKWLHVVSKTPAHGAHRLGIPKATYRSLVASAKKEFGRFVLTPISHTEAQNLFANFPEELLDFVELGGEPGDPRI